MTRIGQSRVHSDVAFDPSFRWLLATPTDICNFSPPPPSSPSLSVVSRRSSSWGPSWLKSSHSTGGKSVSVGVVLCRGAVPRPRAGLGDFEAPLSSSSSSVVSSLVRRRRRCVDPRQLHHQHHHNRSSSTSSSLTTSKNTSFPRRRRRQRLRR